MEKKDNVIIHQNFKIDCRIMISSITKCVYKINIRPRIMSKFNAHARCTNKL